MSDLKTSVIIDLKGNLEQRAQRYSRSMNKFATRGQRSLRMLGRTADRTGRMLDRMGNRYTGILTGAGAVGTGKMVIDLQTRFTRLGIQANKSADEMNRLKTEIYDTASAPDIRVDPGQITSAIEAIVEKTGDLEFARDNIRNIGLAIQATGAQGGAIGELMAEFQKMGIKAPQEVLKSIDTLNVQGKEGAFTLENLASLGPRVITAYTSMGRTGTDALKEMGAALQVVRMGTGNSEQAATAFEATLRALADPKKIKQLEKVGISLFDAKQLEQGKRVLRPINELMIEIIEKSKGDKTKLGLIFDAEAVRAFNQAAGEFQRTGSVNSLGKFMQVQGDGATTMKDSARAAKDASAALTNLFTAWKRFADESLTEPIQDAADLLNSISSETTGKVIKGAVITGISALVAGKAYGLGSRLFGKGKKGAGGLGGGLGGMPLPLPVYVVNSRMSLTNDAMTGGAASRGGKAGRLSRFGNKALKFGSRALPLAAAGMAGWELGSVINEKFVQGTDFGDALGKSIANVLAFFGNDSAQASIKRDEEFEKYKESQKFNGELRISIDSEGKPTVKQLNTDNQDIELMVDSGMTLAGA